MGANSKIEWTDHTFNPWIGCEKVSPGCRNCYAEKMQGRFGGGLWGHSARRKLTSVSTWEEPLRWNRKAAKLGVRHRVFCGSLCDVFEDTNERSPDLGCARAAIFSMIARTPNLTWLLLTKRPGNILTVVATEVGCVFEWPRNAWLGVSVEDQVRAAERIPVALTAKAKLRIPGLFVSAEPLLGPIHFTSWREQIDWVICGGESGKWGREMKAEWAADIRDECISAGVPFFFKQWGEYNESGNRLGTAHTGRRLSGVEWNEFPKEMTK